MNYKNLELPVNYIKALECLNEVNVNMVKMLSQIEYQSILTNVIIKPFNCKGYSFVAILEYQDKELYNESGVYYSRCITIKHYDCLLKKINKILTEIIAIRDCRKEDKVL